MTVEEFEQELNDLGQELQTFGQAQLTDIVGQVVAQMQAKAPIQTGALKRSIQATINPDLSFSFFMLDYGFYQNYGVAGFDANQAITTPSFGLGPDSLAPRSGWGTEYAFTDRRDPDKKYNYNRYGIKAKEFFSIEEQRDFIVTTMQQYIDNI